VISSTKNTTVRAARRLRKPLHRDSSGFFVAEGPAVLDAALHAGAPVRTVFHIPAAASRREALLKEAARSGARVHAVSHEVMAYLSGARATPEVLAVVGVRDAPAEAVGAGPGVLLAGVRDPRAAGAILATAGAVGMPLAIAAAGTADVYGERAVRAARGAHFAIETFVRGVGAEDAAARIRAAGGRVIALDAEGPAPWEADLAGPFVLACGDEAAVLSEERVAVPGDVPLVGRVAVVLFEALRQRMGSDSA
jgi:TrmH family RNA methyltransferase